jgi:hypothetical protein
MESMRLVGLDVHAAQTHAAVLDSVTGEVQVSKLRVSPGEIVDFLAGLGPVRAVSRVALGMGRQQASPPETPRPPDCHRQRDP